MTAYFVRFAFAGFACALQRPPTSAVGTAVQALTLLIEQRLVMDVEHFAGRVRIKVIPPLCPLSVSAADFTRAGELIDRAHKATARWLDEGGPLFPNPERFLSLHHHADPSPPVGDHDCAELVA